MRIWAGVLWLRLGENCVVRGDAACRFGRVQGSPAVRALGCQLDYNRRAEWERSMRTILYLAIVALIAASSCSSSESSSDSGSELPADAEQVIRDNVQAQVDQDLDAWQETITDDFVHRRGAYGNVSQERLEPDSYDEAASGFAHRIEFYETPLEYEQVGDLFVTGDGPWFVTIRQRWIALFEPDEMLWEGNATYVVVERDGVMKVAAEYSASALGFVED